MKTHISPAVMQKAQEHARLGIMAMSMGEITRAISEFRTAAHDIPTHPDLAMQLGAALIRSGQLSQALLWLQRANDAAPSMRLASAELFVLNCMDMSSEDLSNAHCMYETRWTSKVKRLSPRKPRKAGTLHIGYVSADFKRHPVASFIAPILRNHNREAVKVYGYSSVGRIDETTLELKALCHAWRDVSNVTDNELARCIRDDELDVLVDLSGHTSGNRLGAFAHKPAPVQVSYVGYGNTTGMLAMDWRITDAITDHEGDECQYTEKLYRMPGCFLCWHPPDDAPPVAEVDYKRPLRFGSFNAAHKINERTIKLWGTVLKAVPDSVLVLKADAFRDDGVRQRYEKMFALAGVPHRRLEFWAPPGDYTAHLSLYEDIDVALDCVPYNGTTTTCEAAYMGVPTLTLRGDRHLSRVSTSINKAIGYTCGFNCYTVDEFVNYAVSLSNARKNLAERRSDLREEILTSPLCDGVTFTRNLEAAYKHMVEQCE